jgi:fibronectin-binding autotransporter adhesin
VIALVLSVGIAEALPPTTTAVYGTTPESNSGTSYIVGTIASGSAVRLDDGAAVTGTAGLAINGELQFNKSTGILTIGNVVSGDGTLTLSNSGTLQLTGTNASNRIPLNMTINTSDGRLMGPLVSGTGTENGIFQLGASGTGTLNVSGGFVSGSSWQIGVGSTGVGTVTVTGGTFGPFGTLTVGGTSGGSGGTGTLTINGGVVGDNPLTPLNVGGFRFGVAQNSSGVATITSGTLRATSIATQDGATGSFIGLAGAADPGCRVRCHQFVTTPIHVEDLASKNCPAFRRNPLKMNGLRQVRGLGLEPRTNWLKANCSTS